ncbi:hypothetical protein Cs7R123_63470 [Catellatospora sp. TT07R-123]|uniref:hypothetical protein n=1 Tax=Catellatospora sp. TT07R-123 TaxID=2733863 RepID=UPI001B1C2626|nr:hypothetical protein [Catellatospora sp. TT07R-123]GHJ49005.1 hypothetical protein Cs7R123_63470 [Catellatospora sp. TT07R-123]
MTGYSSDDNLTCDPRECTTDLYDLFARLPRREHPTYAMEQQFFGVAPGTPSVEYGAGDGRLTRWVQPTYAVELSTATIESIEHLALTTKFIAADMCHVELPEKVSVSVVGGETLSNFSARSLEEFFRNAARNSLPDGELRFDLLASDYFQGVRARRGERWHDLSTIRGFPCWEQYRFDDRQVVHAFLLLADGEVHQAHLHEFTHSEAFLGSALHDAGWVDVEFTLHDVEGQPPLLFVRARGVA